MTLVTDAETLRGSVTHEAAPIHMVFVGNTALHMLSMNDAGDARYSVHLETPMVLSYRGTCEGFD
ncbi:hypothetical protein KDD17_06910 [Sulfitobacter albidus]|uniref:Uncharacterized protein n=1 Tax=Sulfitobacter albidus TaxID=2829501 RepID=A0A975JG49_9RHOB|nr:hypothetical protein [Sulfitobacter albidus]QUJ77682.1 hypothetical protein KDD17_06910 [Sulfitobacter albidus]